jgi:hypothetical protein
MEAALTGISKGIYLNEKATLQYALHNVDLTGDVCYGSFSCRYRTALQVARGGGLASIVLLHIRLAQPMIPRICPPDPKY